MEYLVTTTAHGPAGTPEQAAQDARPARPSAPAISPRSGASCGCGRRLDAREQLSTAYDMLAAIGMEAFAERARRELIATGKKVHKHSPETRDQLTPQEEQIARLARDGRTNLEISAQLFLSARTVEWHMRKVFTKLGITSRRQLRATLTQPGQTDRPA